MHDDVVPARHGLRFEVKHALSGVDEQAALSACMLERGAHQLVDELVEDELSRHGLRDLEDGREVEVFDGRDDAAHGAARRFLGSQMRMQRVSRLQHAREVEVLDRRGDGDLWTGRWLVGAQVRVERVELPHFAVGTPAHVAAAGVAQVQVGDLLAAARPVEACRRLVCEGLVVDVAVGAGRAHGVFVEAHRISIAPVDASELGADQRDAVPEGLGAVPGPFLELAVVAGQRVQVPDR